MQKSRLIEILRTFSKKEFREFKKWLTSPFHNQRQDLIDLYLYLTKNSHLFNDDALNKQKIFKTIYPKQDYDDAKMRQVIHFMFKALESYLSYISFIEKGVNQDLSLAREYRKRNIRRSFEKTIKNIESVQKNPVFQDDFYLYQQYNLQIEKYKFDNKSTRRVSTFNLQEISDSFDLYFIANKLKQASWMLSHQVVFKTKYTNYFLPSVLNYLEQKKSLLEVPAIGIYYFAYNTLFNSENIHYFMGLKDKLYKNSKVLPENEMKSLYLFAINYCTNKVNSGKNEFLKETWSLLKEGIENEILVEDGILNQYLYKNFISATIRLNYFDKAEKYILSYGKLLGEEHRENYINFLLAKLYFEQGSYEKSMKLVSQYEFKDILVHLSAKIMLLKMYYELSEYNTLESLLESIRAYLQRKNKMMGSQHIALYKNIVRYTKKLLKVNPYNKEQVSKLRLEIEAATPLTEKAWLLKQIDEL